MKVFWGIAAAVLVLLFVFSRGHILGADDERTQWLRGNRRVDTAGRLWIKRTDGWHTESALPSVPVLEREVATK